MGLEELQQKLWGQISTIGPDHGTQVMILVRVEKQVLVPERGEDLAPQLVQQGYLTGYAVVEFKVKPIEPVSRQARTKNSGASSRSGWGQSLIMRLRCLGNRVIFCKSLALRDECG